MMNRRDFIKNCFGTAICVAVPYHNLNTLWVKHESVYVSDFITQLAGVHSEALMYGDSLHSPTHLQGLSHLVK